MSTPDDKKTVAELAKELGIAIDKRDETIGSLKDAIKNCGSVMSRFAGLQQSSIADHVRAETAKAHVASLHDRIERDFGKGARIALMSHDEIIVEAPTREIVKLGGDIIEDRLEGLMTHGITLGMSNAPELASAWSEATPNQILEDINHLAEQMRAAVPPVPAANYAGVSMPIVPMEFEQLEPQHSDHAIAVAMHARVGGVVSFQPNSLAHMAEAVMHGDQTEPPAYAREYTLGHWHRRTPPMATINCRCYLDYRVVVGRAEEETYHYEPGEDITRAPWHMPRLRIAGRPIDPRALGWLAVVYDRAPGKKNRHTARRWLRRFRSLLDVASDALREANRPRAIEVLSEMIGANEAIDLTTPVTTVRSHWTGTLTSKPVEHVAPFEQLIGRLKTDHPQIAEWEQALAELPAVTRAGVLAVPLVPGTPPPPPGAAVYVDDQGRYRFAAAPRGPAAPVGTYIGPGETPGTMLMRFGEWHTDPDAGVPYLDGVTISETRSPVGVAREGFGTPIVMSGLSGIQPGDGPFRFSNTGGELPAGIEADQNYYALDVETHSIKPGAMSPWPATTVEYAADDARLALELHREIGQAVAPSSGAVLTPDGWRVTCGACTRQVAEDEMASLKLYPVGVCNDCHRRAQGVE